MSANKALHVQQIDWLRLARVLLNLDKPTRPIYNTHISPLPLVPPSAPTYNRRSGTESSKAISLCPLRYQSVGTSSRSRSRSRSVPEDLPFFASTPPFLPTPFFEANIVAQKAQLSLLIPRPFFFTPSYSDFYFSCPSSVISAFLPVPSFKSPNCQICSHSLS